MVFVSSFYMDLCDALPILFKVVSLVLWQSYKSPIAILTDIGEIKTYQNKTKHN